MRIEARSRWFRLHICCNEEPLNICVLIWFYMVLCMQNVRLREEYVPHILQEKHEVEKRLKESETKIIKLEKEKVVLSEQIQRLTQQKLGTSCAPHAAGGSAAAAASSVTFPKTHHVVV